MEKVTLGSLCERKIETLSTDFPKKIDYIDISSVDNQMKCITNMQCLLVKDAPSRARQLVEAGDIIVSMVRPNLNAVAMVSRKTENTLVASTGYCVLRCLPNVDNKYLFHFCQSPTFIDDMVSQATGATYPAVNASIIKKCMIPLPALDEQRKIAAVLDKVSDLIALRKQQLAELDKLVKARFVEMFGDSYSNPRGLPVLSWNEVFNTTTGKLDSNASVEGGEYPFFTCSKEPLRINKYAFDQEALLLAGNNAAGKYDVKHYKGKFNAYQRTYVLTLKKNWSYSLFKYQLEDKLDYLQQQSLGGLTKYLTLKILGELSFLLPSNNEQEQFADFVAQVDKSKVAVQESLDQLETLKKALMQKYFG